MLTHTLVVKKFFKSLFSILERYKILILSLSIIYVLLIFLSSYIPVTFDDSIFVQVSKNLALKNQYVTNDGALFNVGITTGFPVIIPVALIFKIFSVGVVQERIVSLFYSLLFFLSLYYLLQSIKILNKKQAIVAVIITFILSLFAVNEFIYLLFNAYGEIPALFFYICALLSLNKYFLKKKIRYLFYTGILLGLSFSTKYIMILAIIPILLVFLLQAIKNKRLLGYIILIVGIRIPELIFRVYQILSTGLNDFTVNIHYLINYYHTVDALNHSFNDHQKILWIFGFNNQILAISFITILLVAVISIIIKKFILTYIALFIFLVYFWWFFISHSYALRHLQFCSPLLIYIAVVVVIKSSSSIPHQSHIRQKLLKSVLPVFLSLLIINSVSLNIFKQNLNIRSYSKAINSQKDMINFVNKHSNKNFYYIDFYQAPEISLQTKRVFKLANLQAKFYDDNQLLILTRQNQINNPKEYTEYLNKKCRKILLKSYDYLVCEMPIFN